MNRLLDTEWGFPAAFFGTALLIVVALWAVGDGRGPDAFRGEVRAARTLLVDQRRADPEETAGIQSALRSLDPDAVARARR